MRWRGVSVCRLVVEWMNVLAGARVRHGGNAHVCLGTYTLFISRGTR